MPAFPSRAIEQIAESHEDRLVRLEDNTSEMATQLARVSTEHSLKLEHLTQTVANLAPRIFEKIDACIAPLTLRVNTNTAKIESIDGGIRAGALQIEHLKRQQVAVEVKQIAGRRRVATIKKALLALAVAGGGVLIKELAVNCWRLVFP